VAIEAVVRLPLPRLRVSDSPFSVHGEVLSTDRFGNLVSSIGLLRRYGSTLNLEPWLPGCPRAVLPLRGLRVNVNDSMDIPVSGTYADVPPGALVAYVGSDGLLEIGANRGSAVDLCGSPTGAEVILRPAR
jgi:S-adenosyl-L-methionine hydrolase (adenosine-forming)